MAAGTSSGPLLRASGMPVHLDVVGDGTAAATNQPGVTFHGPVTSESVLAERYASCDVFVAPSTGQESFGIVLLEAMACGRPIVCSDIPGYRQVVDGAGARLVSPGDSEALAGVIGYLAKDPALRRRMGASNRQRAEAGGKLSGHATAPWTSCEYCYLHERR